MKYKVVIPFTFDRLYEPGEILDELPPDGLPLWISMGLVEPVEDETKTPAPRQTVRRPKVEVGDQ